MITTYRRVFHHIPCGALLIFTVLSAIVWYVCPSMDNHFELDSYNYQRVAQFFYHHSQLLDPLTPYIMPVYPLGYPLFMGIIYKLVGIHPTLIFCAQFLLVFICMILVSSIAQTFFSPAIGKYTCYVMAVHSGILVYTQLIMSEILLMTLILACFERLTKFWHYQRFVYAAHAAAYLGACIVVKSIALWFCPLFFMALYRQAHTHAKITFIASLVTIFLLPIIPFILYNYRHYGVMHISPQLHVNLCQYFLPKVIAQVTNTSVASAMSQIPCNTDPQSTRTAYVMLWDMIRTHPFTCAYIWILNMCKTWFGLFTTQLKIMLNQDLRGGACSFFLMSGTGLHQLYAYIAHGTTSWWIILLAILEFLILLIRPVYALIGAWHVPAPYQSLNILIILFICLTVAITGFDGCFRFRIAWEPLIIMYAVAGFVYTTRRVKTWYYTANQRIVR